jgi:hypothetical protein
LIAGGRRTSSGITTIDITTHTSGP